MIGRAATGWLLIALLFGKIVRAESHFSDSSSSGSTTQSGIWFRPQAGPEMQNPGIRDREDSAAGPSDEIEPPRTHLVQKLRRFVDTKLRARQQRGPTCWAYGAEAAANLAWLARDRPRLNACDLKNCVLPDYSDAVQNAAGDSIRNFEPVVYRSNGRQLIPGSNAFTSPFTESRGTVREHPEPQPETARRAPARRIFRAGDLTRRHFGGNSPQSTRYLAARAKWTEKLNIRVLRGQGGYRQQNVKRLVETILKGMKDGVRYEGFFNRVHAMAIIGASASDNSVWVTDSAMGGAVRKLRLDRGRAHIDWLLAFSAKDSLQENPENNGRSSSQVSPPFLR